MNSDQRPAPRYTALNHNKLALSAITPADKTRRASLSWRFIHKTNSFEISCWTNDANLAQNKAMNNGRISTRMDPTVALAVCDLLANIGTAVKPGEEVVIKNMNYPFNPGGERSRDIEHISNLHIGRDGDGAAYITLASAKEGFQTIRFYFGPSDQRFHPFYDGTGARWPKDKLSMVFARSYGNMLRNLMTMVLASDYVHPEKKPGGYGGGQGGGGYNRGGQGGGGYNRGGQGGGGGGQSSPAKSSGTDDYSDDIPF